MWGSIGRRYDDIVSLGRHCQPAYQIRRLTGVEAAGIFDWIYTTDDGLVRLIESGLAGFFALGELAVGGHGVVEDGRTSTRFMHEFPPGSDIAAQHAVHAGRFAMLAERWRALLASDRRALFVRVPSDPEADGRAVAERLRAAIARQAPRLRFTILVLSDNPADDAPWGQKGVLNHHLRQPEPYDWRGDDAVWAALLTQALRAPVPWWRSLRGRVLLDKPPPTAAPIRPSPQTVPPA